MKIAETIFLAGLQQFPDSSIIHNFYSVFLDDFIHDLDASKTERGRAKRMYPGFQERFGVYCQEMEAKQAAQSKAVGEDSMDLVSYIEFQR